MISVLESRMIKQWNTKNESFWEFLEQGQKVDNDTKFSAALSSFLN